MFENTWKNGREVGERVEVELPKIPQSAKRSRLTSRRASQGGAKPRGRRNKGASQPRPVGGSKQPKNGDAAAAVKRTKSPTSGSSSFNMDPPSSGASSFGIESPSSASSSGTAEKDDLEPAAAAAQQTRSALVEPSDTYLSSIEDAGTIF